jgi:oligopeptide transport system permease protein
VSAYAARRILTSIPTLLVIVTVAFFMMRIAPGGPFDRERALPPEIEKNVLAAYDLDQPLLLQYADYLLGVLGATSGPRSSTASSPSPSCCGPGSRRA